MKIQKLIIFFVLGISLAAKGAPLTTETELTNTIAALTVLQKPLEKPSSSDWLAHHPESGQAFQEYISSVGSSSTASGKRIYIQPLGDFSDSQWKVLTTTANYLRCFYNLPVTIDDATELSSVPDAARRQNPNGDQEQILTTYVLDRIARPNVSSDAAAYLVLTTSDLWAGDDWNFVFGQASLKERVGVFSLYRNGTPDKSGKEYRLYLLRTMKTAAHEVGHMLGLQHCVRYRCGMNGSNHRAEADRRPLWFCSECTAKVCWITQTPPLEYFQRLERFCEREGFHTEAEFYRKSGLLLLSFPHNER